jgi:CheY-like chemotaxis protein
MVLGADTQDHFQASDLPVLACGYTRRFRMENVFRKQERMEQNNKSVLVVDDDRDMRYMLSLRLLSAGYMAYGAANGLEALEQMEKHSVNVVLTDHHMPKMDGFEFLSICRKKWPGTPVVIFSGEQDDMVHEAVDRGAFAWVRKGTEFSVLSELLAAAVQQAAHA